MAWEVSRGNSINMSHSLHGALGADALIDLVDVRLILPVPLHSARIRLRLLRPHIRRELPLGLLHLRIPIIPVGAVAVVSEDLQRSILAILQGFVVLLPQLLVLIGGFRLLALHPHPGDLLGVIFLIRHSHSSRYCGSWWARYCRNAIRPTAPSGNIKCFAMRASDAFIAGVRLMRS